MHEFRRGLDAAKPEKNREATGVGRRQGGMVFRQMQYY